MTLNQDQILAEMGLSPRWVMRDNPPVARRENEPAAPAAPIETTLVEIVDTPQSDPMREDTVAMQQVGAFVAEGVQDVTQMDWQELRRNILACRSCGLCAERKQAVPGVGDENADWLFIGEGPGAEEDARGEPFVGQAGKLLDAMLAAIDLARGEDVYIANAVKCRPPGNRTPEASEMAACGPFLKRQIALIRPRLIVLLGRVAVQAVLGEEGSLASLRGKRLAYRDGDVSIPVLVTYHPAYLLRNLPDKAKAWEDLCLARNVMRGLKN